MKGKCGGGRRCVRLGGHACGCRSPGDRQRKGLWGLSLGLSPCLSLGQSLSFAVLLAAALPAMRASRVDPVAVLGNE